MNPVDRSALQMDIDQNTTDITQNTTSIGQNTADITQNTTNITANTAGIAQNTTDITQNTANIAQGMAGIAQNTTDISQNTTGVTQNTAGITQNTAGISQDTVGITQNTADIAQNTSMINQSTEGVIRNPEAINNNTEGIAGAMALSRIPSVLPVDQTFAVSLGVGTFSGENAMAVGGAVTLTDHIFFSGGGAFGLGSSNSGGGAAAIYVRLVTQSRERRRRGGFQPPFSHPKPTAPPSCNHQPAWHTPFPALLQTSQRSFDGRAVGLGGDGDPRQSIAACVTSSDRSESVPGHVDIPGDSLRETRLGGRGSCRAAGGRFVSLNQGSYADDRLPPGGRASIVDRHCFG